MINDSLNMVKIKTIEVISCYLDIVIIFSPFLLLVGGGMSLYLASFYFLYLPYLVFNIYKYNLKKRHKIMLDSEMKKIIKDNFVIH